MSPSEKAPRVVTHQRFVPIRAAFARRYGLDPIPIPPIYDAVLDVQDIWLESELPADSRWRVAYRVLLREGRVIVAEVRVFPRETNRVLGPGEWLAEWLGRKAADVPAGGLSTRDLRSIRLGHDVHSIKAIVDELKASAPQLLDPSFGQFGELGLTAHFGSAAKPKKATGRGRPALDAMEYAVLAAAYADAVAAGSRHPIRDVAERCGLTTNKVRSRIHAARARGFLDRGRQGNAGGLLQPVALKILKKQKGVRRGKTTRKK